MKIHGKHQTNIFEHFNPDLFVKLLFLLKVIQGTLFIYFHIHHLEPQFKL